MRFPRPRFTMRRLMVVVGLAGLALGLYGWMLGRAEALRVQAVNRALARKQLAMIDETWVALENLYQNGYIGTDLRDFGPWGRRRLEALRKAGAGKSENVAALEKYITDLERLLDIRRGAHDGVAQSPSYAVDIHEIQFLHMEAEIWLNEEKAR